VPKPAEQLDARIQIVTPENIAFKYRVAGPFRRLPAYLIDFLIRGGIVVVIGYFAAMAWSVGFLLGSTVLPYVYFVLDWFYGGFFETYWNGQTPGKWALGLRVVSDDGQPINARQAVMRNVLRAVDMIPPPLYLLGLFVASANKRFQRLGDFAAGTIVVVEESPRVYGVANVTEAEAIRLAELIPVNFEPTRSLARALSVYVERRGGFAWGRRAEIARHLAEPLRIKFNLPPETSHDLLLCAAYYRTFIADRDKDQRSARPRGTQSTPFAATVAGTQQHSAMPALSPGQFRAADVHSLLDQMA
jgi:uncharacterized RDD family membrane protein YckC